MLRVDAIHENRSRRRLVHLRQYFHERRLSRTVFTHDGDDRAGRQYE